MFKCFSKNRIFKRQASMMLLFAMLFSMLTLAPTEVHARTYSGQYYNPPEAYTNLVYNGKPQKVFSFAGDSWESNGGWFADDGTNGYGGHTSSSSFTLTNAGTYNLYIWFWSSKDSKSKQQSRLSVTIKKANQTISSPTVASRNGTTVVLNALKAGAGATTYGYSTSENTRPSTWQASTTFTGLSPSTKYYFFAKYAGNNNYNEAISAGTTGLSWTYTLGSNGLKAKCTTVGFEVEKKLRLVTPTKPVYSGDNASDFYPTLDSEAKNDFIFTTDSTISGPTYYSISASGIETLMASAPTSEGFFRMSYMITAPSGSTYDLSKIFEIGENEGYIEPAYGHENNYTSESLNNLGDDEGQLVKRVAGDSMLFNGMYTDLQVELLTNEQPITIYKIADVAWDASSSTYLPPAWVTDVDDWINAPGQTDDFKKNLYAYASPSALAQTTSGIQEEFFRTISADSTLLASLEKYESPEYSSADAEGDSEDATPITKHYALFRKLTFGTYLIYAGADYNPVVKNIFPDRNASGYTIPLLVKASLKGGGLDLKKKINGHDVDTVSVGETVSFDISFNLPSVIKGDSFELTDIMSDAFELANLSSVIVSTNSDGSSPLAIGTYYSIGTKTTNPDGSVTILFTFVSSKIKELGAEKLYIKYDAIVTENIKYNSETNFNTAKLKIDSLDYEDTVNAYTYGLTIVKLDGTSADNIEDMSPLPDAAFNLFKEKYIYIDEAYMGSFDEKSGINYTKTDAGAPADNFIEECLSLPTQYYVYEYEAEEAGTITVDGVDFSYEKGASIIRIYELVTDGIGFSDEKGTITSVASTEGVTIGGLNSGSYILVETYAPAGYQTLAEDIYFEINRLTEEEAQLKTAGSLSSFYEMDETTQLNESGKIKINVLNYKGLILPSTGGIGTLLFTIIGIISLKQRSRGYPINEGHDK